MAKTNAQIQQDMIERRQQAGAKRVTLWINKETTEQAKLLTGMNQSQSMTTAIELGIAAIASIKQNNPNLYLNLVDGELSIIKDKLSSCLIDKELNKSTKTTVKTRRIAIKTNKQKATELSRQGFSHQEVANKLGLNLATVKGYFKK